MNDVAHPNTLRKITRELSDTEVCELARTAANHEHIARQHEREMESLKEDVAEAKKSAQEEIDRVRELMQMVDRGTAVEEVECLEVTDIARARIGVLRVDTGEVIEVRSLKPLHQMNLDEVLDAVPTLEQIAALDAYEELHPRTATAPAIEDEDED